MKNLKWKNILIGCAVCLIAYPIIWLILVGFATVVFNLICNKPQNWFLNKTLPIWTLVVWVILLIVLLYMKISKNQYSKKKGLLPIKEFNKIGTTYIAIDDGSAQSKGWIIDSKKSTSGIMYKHYENSNAIVYGITRAGKTTGFVLPTIYSNATAGNQPCFILTDKKDELYQKTSDYLIKHGYRIWKLDISNAVASNCWNPLSEIWSDYQVFSSSESCSEQEYLSHTSLTDRINNLLDMLFTSKEANKESPFWIESAKEFFAMIIYANLDEGIAQESFTLYELFKQFNKFTGKEWARRIEKIKAAGLVHQHKTIITDVAKAEQTYAGVKASAMAALKFLTDATIQKISSSTDIPLNDFTNKPTALFLTLPSSSTDKTKLSSIYLQSFLKMCSLLPNRENNKDARPIYLLADEIGNIEPISGLSDLITTGLSKKLRCMLVFQSKAQLKAKYPNDYEIIQDNCELLILIKTKDANLAAGLSKAFGSVDKKEKVVNRDADGKITGSSYHTKSVPVLSETEILEMKRGKILVWLAGKKPIITNTLPIDQSKWYKNNITESDKPFEPTKLIAEKKLESIIEEMVKQPEKSEEVNKTEEIEEVVPTEHLPENIDLEELVEKVKEAQNNSNTKPDMENNDSKSINESKSKPKLSAKQIARLRAIGKAYKSRKKLNEDK